MDHMNPSGSHPIMCASCGYAQSGLVLGASCPECGDPNPRRPKVSRLALLDARLQPFGLFTACYAAAIGGVAVLTGVPVLGMAGLAGWFVVVAVGIAWSVDAIAFRRRPNMYLAPVMTCLAVVAPICAAQLWSIVLR